MTVLTYELDSTTSLYGLNEITKIFDNYGFEYFVKDEDDKKVITFTSSENLSSQGILYLGSLLGQVQTMVIAKHIMQWS